MKETKVDDFWQEDGSCFLPKDREPKHCRYDEKESEEYSKGIDRFDIYCENIEESIDYWQGVDITIKDYGIKAGKLARFSGISRQYLNQLRKGTRQLQQHHMDSIEKALCVLNPDKPLNILFDYVKITFPTLDYEKIIHEVLGLNLKRMHVEERGTRGYQSHASLGMYNEIRIDWHKTDPAMGVQLEMKGTGCRYFENILLARGLGWHHFFKRAFDFDARFKRVDIAIDDIYGILDISELVQKCKAGDFDGTHRKYAIYESGQQLPRSENDKTKTALMGMTLYVGSFKSEIHFCAYEKDYEQAVKRGIDMNEALVKNRFELRLKNQRAERAVAEYIERLNIYEVAFGIINEYLAFYEEGTGNDEKPIPDMRWKHFIQDRSDRIKLTTKAEPISLERTIKWLEKQVMPTIKGLTELDLAQGTSVFFEIYDEAKITERFEKVIKQISKPEENVVYYTTQ